MASPFSGRAGRLASIAVGMHLDKNQQNIDQRIDAGLDRSLASLSSGLKDARARYLEARDLYNPYVQTGQKAFGQYADATGVNGQEGYDRSVGNFRASPGYQWAVDQATDGVARKASALGALGSGNTMAAISDRAGHMADQEYDQYLDRLNGVSQMGYDATGRQAGITTGLGDLRTNYANTRAGTIGNYTGMGVNSQLRTGLEQAEALQGGMMAGQSAAANRWNMGMQGLNLLTGLAGRAFGGGF